MQIFCACCQLPALRRILTQPIQYVGSIEFALYLVHEPLMEEFGCILPAPFGTLWMDGMKLLVLWVFDIGCTVLLGFEFIHVAGLRVGHVGDLQDGWIGSVFMSRAKEVNCMEMKFFAVAWRKERVLVFKERKCFEERVI